MWQKRKCSVKNGFLTICHGTVRPRPLLLLVHLHEKLHPPTCMSISQLKASFWVLLFISTGETKSHSLFYLVSYYFPSFFYFEVFTWRVKRPIRTEHAEEEEKEEEKEEHKEKDDREKGGNRRGVLLFMWSSHQNWDPVQTRALVRSEVHSTECIRQQITQITVRHSLITETVNSDRLLLPPNSL